MNLISQVEPHAAGLESCAAAMEAAGIGGDLTNGHVVYLRKMAGDLRSQAARGRLPSSLYAAGADVVQVAAIQACRDAGLDVPASGKFTQESLDAALSKAFDRNDPRTLEPRVR